MPRSRAIVFPLLGLLFGCEQHGIPVPATSAASAETADSAFHAFTADLGAPPTSLKGGAASLEELASVLVAAATRGDSLPEGTLRLSRAEFAHLYYPDAPQSRPPYLLPPEVLWLMLSGQSEKSFARIRTEVRESDVEIASARCAKQRIQGAYRLHTGCVAELRAGSDLVLGPVMELGGRFKFLALGTGD